MTPRSQRRILGVLNVALGLALAASAAALALWPVRVDEAAVSTETPAPDVGAPLQRASEPLSAFAVIYRRDLRQPLYDPKPVVAAPAAPPPPPKPEVDLVGTAVELGYTYAFLQTKAGKVKMMGIGEELDGLRVTAIADGSATVQFHGQTYTLEVKKKETTR